MFILFAPLFLISAMAQTEFHAASYKKEMLEVIRNVSEEIRTVKTTSEPVFIGLGRSPAPMMAALEGAGERVVNLILLAIDSSIVTSLRPVPYVY